MIVENDGERVNNMDTQKKKETRQEEIQQKEDFLKIFDSCLAIIRTACKKANMSRTTYYKWRRDDEDFKKSCENIEESVIDFTESKLHQLINGADKQVLVKEQIGINQSEHVVRTIKDTPNPASVIFYLKTKGKHRGYVEKTEQDLNMKGGIELTNITPGQVDDMSGKEASDILNKLNKNG